MNFGPRQLEIVLHEGLHDASNGATAGEEAEAAEAPEQYY
jgi:hypothetical protein